MTNTIAARLTGSTPSPTDEALLARFVRDHDTQAFHLIVQRHAPLIWSVCRRIVRRHQSAEDAFQATFVVLLQKAPRLQLRSNLSTWLYGVVLRVAQRTQARDFRMVSQPHADAASDPHDPLANLTVRELIDIVQQELAKLPKRYQPVLELCLFSQLPVRQAAERLQLSTGAVRGCLERGRELLQARLVRRGVTLLALATLSLTRLQSHQLPPEVLTTVQGLVSKAIPERLLTLISSSGPAINPMVVSLAISMIVITGIALGLVQLFSTSVIAMPAAVLNNIIEPVKPVNVIQGFVDNHEGKPVPHAKVEVYRDRKLEQVLTADGVGRFEIPGAWKNEPGVYRTLLVRHGNEAIGWSDRLNPYSMVQQDLRIVVLPLQAVVRGTMRNEKGEKLSGSVGENFWFSHPVNGSLSRFIVLPATLKLPGTIDQQGRFRVKVPIRTQGMFFVSGKECIDRRVTYASSAAGDYDIEEITLRPSGTIQGVVLDANGKPIAGASVHVQQNHTDREHSQYVDGTWGTAVSDAQGRFVVNGLEPRTAFNIYLLEPVTVPGDSVPLTLRAKEAIQTVVGKPTEMTLKLEKARKIEGWVVDAQTKKPLAQVGVGYHGSARPRSSAGIMGTTSDAQGYFHFWAPPGETMLYCNDGKHNATIDVTIPETDPISLITLKAEQPDRPPSYHGSGMIMGYQLLKVNETQPVVAEGETPRAEPFGCYQQIIELQSESTLPATVKWRVYQKDKPLESGFNNPMSGETTRTDKSIVIVMPYQIGQTYSIELDLEGHQPVVHEYSIPQEQKPLTIKLTPVRCLPLQVKLVDSQDKPAAQGRVQVELKRLGKVIDAPWGPVGLSTPQGTCKVEHIRLGDTYRLRAWGQDGTTAATDWQTLSTDSTTECTLKLTNAGR